MPDVVAQQNQAQVAGQPMKSFRHIKCKDSEMKYDDKTHVLTVPDEFGYEIQFHIEPLLSINQTTPFMNNVPEYQTNILMRPVKIERTEKALNQKAIQEKLKTSTVVPSNIEFDNFSIGFVYADGQNPMNHKWMLEYRKNEQVFFAQHFEGIRLQNVDIGTMAWQTPPIWHGRFTVKNGAFKTILEDKPNWIVIKGKAPSKHVPKGDTSLIKEGIVKLKFRYNVKTNVWYADQIDASGTTAAEPISFKNVLGGNITMYGDVDWGHQKPKVSTYMDVNDISDIKLMADTLIITGK